MTKKTKWTDEVIAFLMEMWNETDSSANEVAAELYERFGEAFTKNAIIGKANRLKLKPRRTGDKPRKVGKLGLTRKESQEITRVYQEAARPGDMGLWKRFDIIEPKPSGDINITEVAADQCRWPIGDPLDDDFHLCGAQCPLTNPYCNYHMVARTMIKERPAVVARLKREHRARA